MSVEALRAIARAHGIAAAVATAALIMALGLLFFEQRSGRRRAFAVGAVAVASITLAGALGLLLDDAYRSRLRQRLFVEAPALGWLFERKQHLAFGAILLGWSGLCSLGAAWLLATGPSQSGADRARRAALSSELARAAKVGWAAAAILAFAALAASVRVAQHTRF